MEFFNNQQMTTQNHQKRLEEQERALTKNIPDIESPWLKEKLETMLINVREKLAHIQCAELDETDDVTPEDVEHWKEGWIF